MASEAHLIEIMKSAGLYQLFDCGECRDRGNFVSGPHSHVCSVCKGRAVYGWYTMPLCEDCKKHE